MLIKYLHFSPRNYSPWLVYANCVCLLVTYKFDRIDMNNLVTYVCKVAEASVFFALAVLQINYWNNEIAYLLWQAD
jgi:hypothetical protein